MQIWMVYIGRGQYQLPVPPLAIKNWLRVKGRRVSDLGIQLIPYSYTIKRSIPAFFHSSSVCRQQPDVHCTHPMNSSKWSCKPTRTKHTSVYNSALLYFRLSYVSFPPNFIRACSFFSDWTRCWSVPGLQRNMGMQPLLFVPEGSVWVAQEFCRNTSGTESPMSAV